MKIHNLTQGTPEWHALRAGRMTASHANTIAVAGKGLETYIYETIASKFSSAEPDNYTNEQMRRGNELEAQARDMYELETGNEVKEVGFIEIDEYSGASPDGLIGDDGGLEIKCHNDKNHFLLILNGKEGIAKNYYMQIQMNLLASGRKWWDYCAYNPNFKRSLIIHRIERDEVVIEKIKMGLEKGKNMIKDILNKLK